MHAVRSHWWIFECFNWNCRLLRCSVLATNILETPLGGIVPGSPAWQAEIPVALLQRVWQEAAHP